MLHFRRKFSSGVTAVKLEGQRKEQTAPVIIEGEEEWEVE